MSPVVFFLLAIPTVVAALVVVFHRNPVHCACGLVATLFLLSVFFVGLDAHLVAALQVIVYAGAVVVLFLFVIMLLDLEADARAMAHSGLVGVGLTGGLALVALLLAAERGGGPATSAAIGGGFGETRALAERLFTTYLLPFELTSLLLLVAIVGAIALAKRGS